MSGNHRAEQPGKARVAVAGALTAGALMLAPAGVAVVAAPGIAHAAPGGGGPGAPTGPADPGPPGGVDPGAPATTKKIIHLPGLKIEIKKQTGVKTKIKFVPFPNVHLPQH